MRIIAVIATLLVAAFFALRTPDTNAADMVAKYGGPPSAFAEGAKGLDGGAGLRVHYRDEGCRDCPAIVLIHGSSASLHTFTPLTATLRARYRIITYDQPGHGLTGPHPQGDYSADGMAAALVLVVETLGLDTFTLGGNSMGGWVSWRYALANPERVGALILIDASGAPPPEDAEPAQLYLGARLLQNPIGQALVQHITPRNLVKRSLLDSVANPAFVSEAMIDRYWELLRYPGNRRATALRSVTDRESAYGKSLPEITAPTLILWGTEDQVTPVYDAETFERLIPNARRVMIDDAAHLPMEEKPTETAAAIEAFMADIAGDEAAQ
ncbi:MAG: alpha/beta hydrolase [Pseudomonadota bacterium]